MTFRSRRIPRDLSLNRLAAARARMGEIPFDLTLGGLSKSVGLPQLKLAWIVASGPDGDVEAALEGLEFIADAYPPVSPPVALAAPQLLTEGAAIREAILARCRVNLETLHANQ